jgi:hypothetical protein
MPSELPLNLAFRLDVFPLGKAAPPMAQPEDLGDPAVVGLEPTETGCYGLFVFELSVPVSK